MVLSCFSVTAFAYADDTEQNLPVTEATQPEQQPETTPTPEKPKGEPIDDEGNAYTRDLLYDKATNKQFITVQTTVSYTHLDVYKRQAMGYKRIITYTLESENGASLWASGWICQGKAGGLRWTGKRQPKEDQYPAQMKLRYEKQLRKEETVNGICSGPEGS